MKFQLLPLSKFVWRIASAHTIAYFIAGIFAISFLNYNELFNVGALSFMRSTDSSWVAAGPGLQIFRGIILGFVLIPFRSIFIETKYGWIKFGVLILGLSSILTQSAAVGSFEGIIYTNIPLEVHFLGVPEGLIYIGLFSLILWFWYKKTVKSIQIISIVLTILIMLMSFMGVLAAKGILKIE